jgi:hypothetical protein
MVTAYCCRRQPYSLRSCQTANPKPTAVTMTPTAETRTKVSWSVSGFTNLPQVPGECVSLARDDTTSVDPRCEPITRPPSTSAGHWFRGAAATATVVEHTWGTSSQFRRGWHASDPEHVAGSLGRGERVPGGPIERAYQGASSRSDDGAHPPGKRSTRKSSGWPTGRRERGGGLVRSRYPSTARRRLKPSVKKSSNAKA